MKFLPQVPTDLGPALTMLIKRHHSFISFCNISIHRSTRGVPSTYKRANRGLGTNFATDPLVRCAIARTTDTMTGRFLCEIIHSNDRSQNRLKFAVKRLNDIAHSNSIAKTTFFSILDRSFFYSLTEKRLQDD